MEAVRRAHDDELRTLAERPRDRETSREAIRSARVVEQMREELSSLHTLFNEKCKENKQLDERIAEMQSDSERERLLEGGGAVVSE